jgi:Tfp pilus assembly protein FimV
VNCTVYGVAEATVTSFVLTVSVVIAALSEMNPGVLGANVTSLGPQ